MDIKRSSPTCLFLFKLGQDVIKLHINYQNFKKIIIIITLPNWTPHFQTLDGIILSLIRKEINKLQSEELFLICVQLLQPRIKRHGEEKVH